MGRKIPSLITGMKVDRATFHNAHEKISVRVLFRQYHDRVLLQGRNQGTGNREVPQGTWRFRH